MQIKAQQAEKLSKLGAPLSCRRDNGISLLRPKTEASLPEQFK
jgi:hypothetical protein